MLELRVRCGLHIGDVERRDNDYFGGAVNRAARIMAAAHGGQAVPEHVFQLVHPELQQDFPALRSLETTPNNLPQQISSFVGRAREAAEVRELISRSRLLTLVGVGGIGKTRLALQVASETHEGYPERSRQCRCLRPEAVSSCSLARKPRRCSSSACACRIPRSA